MKIITKAVLDMETMQWVSVESYDYEGAIEKCCGPSSQEQQLANQGQSFSTMLQGNYGTLFGQQQGVLNSINKSLSPILAAGPSQQGFSAQERAALNTQAINSAGAASRNAQQSVANFGAGQGGGNSSGLISGVQKQLQGAVASQSANQLATAQNQITQADFAQGNNDYWKAQGGMDALAQGYSPNAAQSGSISANQNAFGEANQIQTQKNQEQQAIAGGIEGLAGMATGGIANLDPNAGSSTPFEQFQNFLGGM
jgi:hypothetical protein